MIKELDIVSKPSEARRVLEWIETTAYENGVEDKVIFKATLSADEAIGNVIDHAYDFSEEGRVKVILHIEPTEFCIEIRDSGLPFNPLAVPKPKPAKNVEDAKIGGLGIHLIRKYCDSVGYQRLGEENIFTLVFSRDADA